MKGIRFWFAFSLIVAVLICGAGYAEEYGYLTVNGESWSGDQLAQARSGAGWDWNPETRELTLNNYDGGAVSCTHGVVVPSGTSSRITASGGAGLGVSAQGSLSGGGSLTILNETGNGVSDCNLVSDVTLDITAKTLVSGYSLTMKNVKLNSSACENGVVANSELNLTDCDITIGKANIAVCAANSSKWSGGSLSVSNCDSVLSFPYASRLELEDLSITAQGNADGCLIAQPYIVLTAARCNINLKNIGGFNCKRVEMTDCVYDYSANLTQYPLQGEMVGLLGKSTVTIRCATVGILSPSVHVSGESLADIRAGRAAMSGGTLILNGEAISMPSTTRVVIKNGAIEESRDELTLLKVGDEIFEADDLLNDQSGEGWKWNGSENRLTLDGFRQSDISSSGAPLNLTVNGKNVADTVRLGAGGKIDGAGTLEARLLSARDWKLDFVGGSCSVGGLEAKDISVSGGELAVVRSPQCTGDLSVSAGRLTMDEYIKLGGDFTMSGGTINSKSGIFADGQVNITGGKTEIPEGEYFSVSGKSVDITGGDINLRSRLYSNYAIEASNGEGVITIGGNANVTVECEGAAFNAKKVIIGGKLYKGTGCVTVENGKLVKNGTGGRAFVINSNTVTYEQSLSDIDGDGWHWIARDKVLELTGELDSLQVVREGVTALVPKGANAKIGNCLALSDFTLSGPGNLEANWLSSYKKITVKGGLNLTVVGSIRSDTDIVVAGSDINAEFVQAYGNITVKKSVIRVKDYFKAGKNASVSGSVLFTPKSSEGMNESTIGDVHAEGKFTSKDSAIVAGRVSAGKKTLKGTMLFIRKRLNDSEACGLDKSVTMKKALSLPKEDYVIPRGITLKAKAKLVFHGTLTVRGKISGKITLGEGQIIYADKGESPDGALEDDAITNEVIEDDATANEVIADDATANEVIEDSAIENGILADFGEADDLI